MINIYMDIKLAQSWGPKGTSNIADISTYGWEVLVHLYNRSIVPIFIIGMQWIAHTLREIHVDLQEKNVEG